MGKEKLMLMLIMIIVCALIFFIFLNYSQNNPNADVGGKIKSINIQSPHPYSNSDNGRKVVWSDNLEVPGTTFLKLHFNRFDIKGFLNLPIIWENVDYGACDLNMLDDITIQETQLVKCGIIKEKKQFSVQEIFDNKDEYIIGDFVAIKNKEGGVLDILLNENSWGKTYSGMSFITIELYADNSNNGFGIYIDQYAYGII